MSETPPPPPEDPGSIPPPPPAGGQPYGGQPAGPPYGQPPGPPYGAQPPYGGQPYGGQPYGAPPANNQKAVWAMVLGIVGLLCCAFAGIAAIILGKQAQNEIDASGGVQGGRGMATAGFVLGIIAIVGWVVIVAFYVVVIGLSTGSST